MSQNRNIMKCKITNNVTTLLNLQSSLILLAAQPCQLVGDNNIKLSRTFHNLFPLPCGHIVCNLCTVTPVVHHQNLKLFDVVNKKFLETIGKIVTRLLVRAIANIGHQSTSLELSSYSRINTLWSTPAWLNKNI